MGKRRPVPSDDRQTLDPFFGSGPKIPSLFETKYAEAEDLSDTSVGCTSPLLQKPVQLDVQYGLLNAIKMEIVTATPSAPNNDGSEKAADPTKRQVGATTPASQSQDLRALSRSNSNRRIERQRGADRDPVTSRRAERSPWQRAHSLTSSKILRMAWRLMTRLLFPANVWR